MKMKRSLVLTFAILFLITNSVLVSAITGSMGNARMVLYPEVNGWTNTVIEKSINVYNVNNVSINITLSPDANATKFINVIDKTFILEPGENKTAQFEVKVRKEGTYQGQINVFFRSANGTEGGVVLSSTIIVIAKKNQGYTDNSTDTTNNNPSGNGTHVGNPTGSGQGLSTPVIVFGISTIVLIIILLLLLYIWNKKRSKSKKRKDKFK
jgi:hypothetical protein